MQGDFSSIKRRLDLLRRSQPDRGRQEEPPPEPSLEGAGIGFLAADGWTREGEWAWRRRVTLGALADFRLDGGPDGEPLFLDLETTGLSGGTGNNFFLTGLAWPEGGRLVGEQLFLADFPGEPELLEMLAARLATDRTLVTYNGKCFDCQLIRTRFLLNGRRWEPGEQLDLLYWARRLWKAPLGDCSLGNIERHVLGVTREGDVPGWEIPDVYFRWLRTGQPGRLPAVFTHNLEDIRSLARLLGLRERALRAGEVPPRADGAGLGAWLLQGRGLHSGTAILRGAFEAGDPAAGRALSLFHKRARRWPEALELWRRMAERRSLFAAVELAKYHEHRAKDLQAALEWVERAFAWALPLDEDDRAELSRRRERLRRRLRA